MKKPKIKYSLIYIMFKKWFKKNHQRFPNTPQIGKLSRNGFSLVFPRVKNIAIEFEKHGAINVWARKGERFTDEDADILTDFDLFESKNERGYYCEHCVEREYFQDRQLLWAKHSFEFLLEWANENIKSENVLYFYETENKGGLRAKIKKQDELEKDKDLDLRVFCGPIINPGIKR